MKNIDNIIRSRRSVRIFDGRNPEPELLDKLQSFGKTLMNPFGVEVDFKLGAKKTGLKSVFFREEPAIFSEGMEYIASYSFAL